MKTHITLSVVRLIKYLKINVTTTSIIEQLEEHPNFPSLLAVSDTLNSWNIDNATYNLDINQLRQLTGPYLVHSNKGENSLLLVKLIDDAFVYYIGDNNKEETISIDEFESGFTGNALVLEYGNYSGEIDYKIKREKEIIERFRIPSVIAMVISILALGFALNAAFLNTFAWEDGVLILAKLFGLAISVLLLVQSVDVNNPFVSKICGRNRNVNCNSILSSNASKVFLTNLTWSEVGFFYFASTVLFLTFNSFSKTTTQVLFLLNVVCLPYTFYSIYYQARIAKKWCLMCCIIQTTLWLEFFFLMKVMLTPYEVVNVRSIMVLLICILVPIATWTYIKPYLLLSEKVKPLNKQLKKFKYNRELFYGLLTSGTKYELLKDIESVILGNSASNNVITIVSNPHCTPCAETHKIVENWLNLKSEIKLQIVFAPNMDEGKLFAKDILSIELQNDKDIIGSAISDWFKDGYKNYKQWKKKYWITENNHAQDILSTHREWCNFIKLEYTPTVLINGYKLPESYSLEDVKNFL